MHDSLIVSVGRRKLSDFERAACPLFNDWQFGFADGLPPYCSNGNATAAIEAAVKAYPGPKLNCLWSQLWTICSSAFQQVALPVMVVQTGTLFICKATTIPATRISFRVAKVMASRQRLFYLLSVALCILHFESNWVD